MSQGLRFLHRLLMIAMIFVFLSSMLLINDAQAFPRKVLFEDFTSTTCGPCALFASSLEMALEQVDEIAVPIGMHMSWPAPNNDPWYLDNTNDNNGRRQYYGVNSIPKFFIDGAEYAGARTTQAVAAAITQRSRQDSPITIEIEGSFRNDNLAIDVIVTSEQNLQDLKLQVAIVEEYYNYAGATQQRDHYDSMVRMIPSHQGTSFNIAANQSQDFQLEFDMDGVGWHELQRGNLNLTAWVQNDNSEVHQSEAFLFADLSIFDYSVVDEAEGNGDGRAEPGETAGMVITIANGPSRGGIENVTVELSCNDNQIDILNHSFVIEMLGGGEEFSNEDAPLQFTVPEDFEPNAVTFNIEVTSEDGILLTSKELTFTVGWPKAIIIDAANNSIATQEIMEMFGEGGPLPYADRFDRSEEGIVTTEIIENYEVVIWHSFNTEADVIDPWEEEELMYFLNNGGTVIVSSPEYVRTNGDSQFMTNYMGATLNDADQGENWIRGIEGNPYFADTKAFAGGRANDCAGYPTHTPSLTPVNGGEAVLNWGDEGVERTGVCAITHETDNYRTLLLAFPIESIGGFLTSEDRAVFIQRMWDWYVGPNSAPGDESVQPVTFSLNPAYPNPFNSQTVVPFTLDKAGEVSINVFDLSGRNVQQLLSGFQAAGAHSVTFNAGNAGLISGVYYLKLTAGDNVAGQKVLYLK